jgi:hypothetical protein
MRIIIFVIALCFMLSETAMACICPGHNFDAKDPNAQTKAAAEFENFLAKSEFVGLAKLFEIRPRDAEEVKKEIEYYKARNEFPIPSGRELAVLEPIQSYKTNASMNVLTAVVDGAGCSSNSTNPTEIGKIYEIIVFRNRLNFAPNLLGNRCSYDFIGKNWNILRDHAATTPASLRLKADRKSIGKTWAVKDHVAGCYSENKDK